MDIIRAKEIVKALADGVDPSTGEVPPEDCVYNKVDVVRALFTVLEALPDMREPFQNAGKPWTGIEDDKLRDEYSEKKKTTEIAREHGRSRNAIESRLDLLGLKKRSFWRFKK